RCCFGLTFDQAPRAADQTARRVLFGGPLSFDRDRHARQSFELRTAWHLPHLLDTALAKIREPSHWPPPTALLPRRVPRRESWPGEPAQSDRRQCRSTNQQSTAQREIAP